MAHFMVQEVHDKGQLGSLSAKFVSLLGTSTTCLFSTAHQREKGSMGRAVSVVKLPKSGGVVAREADKRKQARTNRVREYFYGPMNNLQPQSQTVAAEKLSVFRIGGRVIGWGHYVSGGLIAPVVHELYRV